MARSGHARLVEVALRCYSTTWRERHAEEAAHVAECLMQDGLSAGGIAWSFLTAAARDRLITRPKRRFATSGAVLLLGATLVGVPLALLDSYTAANAASNNEVVVVAPSRNTVRHLESFFRSHHFDIKVAVRSSPPSQIGSVLVIESDPTRDKGPLGTLRIIRRPCTDRVSECIDTLAVPLHFTGRAEVVVGGGPNVAENSSASPNLQRSRKLNNRNDVAASRRRTSRNL
jgi:hypothetical protein